MSRFPPKDRPGTGSRAAWLVLLTAGGQVKALLFNADQRYLTEVIDDPLTVDRLCGAGRRCELPAGLALNAHDAGDAACFALGSH